MPILTSCKNNSINFSDWKVIANEEYVHIRLDSLGILKKKPYPKYVDQVRVEELTYKEHYENLVGSTLYEEILFNPETMDTVILLSDKKEINRNSIIQRELILVEKRKVRSKSIDCNRVGVILDSLHQSDQSNRSRLTYSPLKDFHNLEVVISLINNCNLLDSVYVENPALNFHSIWLVLQHNGRGYQERYLPFLQNLAKFGKIRMSSIAMMKDRILLDKGELQLYGTQPRFDKESGRWYIPCLKNAVAVDSLRRSVDILEPLKDYAENWHIEFNANQYVLEDNCF